MSLLDLAEVDFRRLCSLLEETMESCHNENCTKTVHFKGKMLSAIMRLCNEELEVQQISMCPCAHKQAFFGFALCCMFQFVLAQENMQRFILCDCKNYTDRVNKQLRNFFIPEDDNKHSVSKQKIETYFSLFKQIQTGFAEDPEDDKEATILQTKKEISTYFEQCVQAEQKRYLLELEVAALQFKLESLQKQVFSFAKGPFEKHCNVWKQARLTMWRQQVEDLLAKMQAIQLPDNMDDSEVHNKVELMRDLVKTSGRSDLATPWS